MPQTLLEHRVKRLSQRAASLGEAHLLGSARSHHSQPACWDSSLPSQPGSGLSPLLSRWSQVLVPVLGLCGQVLAVEKGLRGWLL